MQKKHTYLKINDQVEVTAGKDKGRVGKILVIDRDRGRAVVEKVNMIKRHMKPRSQEQPGQIVEKEAPVDISNLLLVCSACTKTVRIRRRVLEDGSKVRVCKKCGETIETKA